MHCPECGVEYRPGIFECSDCGVLLVHELPHDAPRDLQEPADDVVIFESTVFGEADMVAAALDEAGIPNTVRRSIAGGVQLIMLEPGLTPGQRMAVSVPRLAERRAREILTDLRPEEDNAEAAATASPKAKNVARFLLLLFFVPFILGTLAMLAKLLSDLF